MAFTTAALLTEVKVASLAILFHGFSGFTTKSDVRSRLDLSRRHHRWCQISFPVHHTPASPLTTRRAQPTFDVLLFPTADHGLEA